MANSELGQLSGIRELTLNDVTDLQVVAEILNDPVNAIHFTESAKGIEDLQQLVQNPNYHLLGAYNLDREIVGTLSVVDESRDVNTYLIEKTAIRSDIQNRGLGREMIEKGIKWAFETPTNQERMRKILVLWVQEDLPGWERMQAIVYQTGFLQVVREPDLVVKTIDGIEVEKPSARYHLRRERYEELSIKGKYRTI